MKNILKIISILTLLMPHASYAKVDKDIDVSKVQTMLTELCYKPGPVDGVWGKKTEKAAEQFFQRYLDGYSGQFATKEFSQLTNYNIALVSDWGYGVPKPKRCAVARPSKKGSVKVKGGDIEIFSKYVTIPDNLNRQPNDATIGHYINNRWRRNDPEYSVIPSNSPLKFAKALEKSTVIDKEMSSSTILSYIYFDDGKIIYDAVVPNNRFEVNISNKTYFPSNSMGKSITSYLIGHAMCQGYIGSVDEPIQDWELMQGTLFYGQPLINLLNMKSGDANVHEEFGNTFKKTGRSISDESPLSLAVRNSKELKNTKPIKNPNFSYSNLTANVLFSYLMHRTGAEFDSFISNFYKNKIKTEYAVYHKMHTLADGRFNASSKDRIAEGAGKYSIWATRYDYLRIAKAMMDDWQTNSCEGKYLKEIYQRRINNNRRQSNWRDNRFGGGKPNFGQEASRYAGQFHTDFSGLKGKNILAMNGYNGQQIIMDMDNSRIVVIAAAKSNHYDTYKLGFEPIKYGRIR